MRVELCENLHEGGTTPSYGAILLARKMLHIKLHVLIRPRSGDFLYNDAEFKTMVADVKQCIAAGCDGIVTGILNADGTVDKQRCSKLIKIAKAHGLSVTFHRAFDVCADMYQAMEDIIEMGCHRILTSGGKSTAMQGAGTIACLIKQAAGRIIIMPGSGINQKNVASLVGFTKATEIHSSARVHVDNKALIAGDNDAGGYTADVTDAGQVKMILKMANGQ